MSKLNKILAIVSVLLFFILWKTFGSIFIQDKSSVSPTVVVTNSSPTPVVLRPADTVTSDKEIAYLKQKLIDAKTHPFWLSSSCIRYVVGESPTYYQIEIHEYHNEGSCPGVKGVNPLDAMFYIEKSDNTISYYDVAADKVISFNDYVATIQKQN